MSDIDYARLMQVIEHGIIDGIKRGTAASRPRVVFHKWERIKDEDIAYGQPKGSYGWSKDQYDGILLDLHTVTESQELCTAAIVKQTNGDLYSIDISQVKVVD